MSSSAEYRVGIATADITPPVGGPLAGFAARGPHTSTGVDHPLRAVTTVIGDGRTDLLLVSVEWLGCYDQTSRLRRVLGERTGIPERQILLSASHTHCGPAIRHADYAEHGWIDEDYLEAAIGKIARAAGIAARHRFPAVLRQGTGGCSVAMSRRLPDPDHPGRVFDSMLPNPDGVTDHQVGVITVESADDGVVRGIMINYACHPTSRGGLKVSGDFVGFAYDHLDEAFPYAQPSFLQGCGGDQKPRPVEPGAAAFGTRTLDQVRDLGSDLGRAVQAAISAGLAPVTGPITIGSAIEVLRTEPVSRETLEAERDRPSASYRKRWAEVLLDRLDRGVPDLDRVEFELQTITFGTSLALVAMAGEMTVEHGLRLKRDHGTRFDQVLPLGYANGMVGYVPVARQFAEYGYEVLDSNQRFFRTGRYLPETEDQLHARIATMLPPTPPTRQ
ncbi:hypothetical protein [Microlunatus speluncae]|uniref:hypothetical protein n=1 Tax=Microlunatus speluncae TaxID=2594267 RepID=UPI0012664F2D|nr:hypothetical protein [Microlunatus speluncae]